MVLVAACYPRPPMPSKKSAIAALLLLTGLNFLNYIDRNVLYAVQPLIEQGVSSRLCTGRLSDLGLLRLLHGGCVR